MKLNNVQQFIIRKSQEHTFTYFDLERECGATTALCLYALVQALSGKCILFVVPNSAMMDHTIRIIRENNSGNPSTEIGRVIKFNTNGFIKIITQREVNDGTGLLGYAYDYIMCDTLTNDLIIDLFMSYVAPVLKYDGKCIFVKTGNEYNFIDPEMFTKHNFRMFKQENIITKIRTLIRQVKLKFL